MSEPTVYDHYRTTTTDGAGELFRVVGVEKERVTLLRLTEAGERAATGELRYVDRAELGARFEPADNPDSRFSIVEYLAALFVGGGGVLAVVSPDDRLGGVILAATGLYLLWRRHG